MKWEFYVEIKSISNKNGKIKFVRSHFLFNYTRILINKRLPALAIKSSSPQVLFFNG